MGFTLIILGYIGFTLNVIILIFASIFKCPQNLIDYCKVKDEQNNSYYDNFLIYCSNLKSHGYFLIFLEIVVLTPLYSFTHFMRIFFEFLTILYLNPISILISDTLYHTPINIIKYLVNKKENRKPFLLFILDIIGNISFFIGALIYLEIMELRFCGLNDILKKR